MAGITVTIANKDRTEFIDARSFSITDEIINRASIASFDFICRNKDVAPVAGNTVLIEENGVKIFSGRVLNKRGEFLNPNQLKYAVQCIDHTRDLDKTLVIKSYTNAKGGDIIKDIIDTYTVDFTYVNVQDGPTLKYISFDYVQVSEAITQVAEACGYQWYIDYNKDLYFFLKTDYPAAFQLDDDQEHYKDLVINHDISQLRNRVYVKSSKYEILDFTELFIGDGSAGTWTCKYQANPLPHPSLTLDGVAKTVGWNVVDDPGKDFYLNAATKVLSLKVGGTPPTAGAEIVITYGADVPIMIRWDDKDSIAAVADIEGGDGIHEFCITDNNIDTKEWAIDRAKADLLENANPVIQGSFLTNEKTIRSGQIITLNSIKRNINQAFLVQRVELVRVDSILEEVGGAEVPFKPAISATVEFKPATEAIKPFKPSVAYGIVVYYVYQVTIATKLKGLEDLLLQLLYQSSESLKRDTVAPDVPSGLALTTGMGEITQAGLTWLKAKWDANIEVDFSHYELKYKKTAYFDYGYVSTTNVSYIWTGLEQNIAYEVYIRSVDIYGNRSDWSSPETQVTTTDTETPAQINDAVATPLLAGIKVEWTKSMGTNIAGYIVEREESDDGITWIGDWIEKVRITSTVWLDLKLPYIKYYHYQIKAYTQAGIEGAASAPTADSIKPNKAGADDIVAGSITGDQIAANTIMANNYQELRNTYVHPGQDSLDVNYPFELDFEIVSEMTSINSIKLSFRIRKFRAYSKGAASGGGATSGSGGGQTSSSTSHTHPGQSVQPGGFHAHEASFMEANTTTTVGHWHRYYRLTNIWSGGSHIHALDIYSSGEHSHYVSAHTHYVYAHTHNLVFGIYEEIQYPTINVYIDNGSGYGDSIGAYTTDQLDINITGHISGTGFKRVKFTSNKRTRISAWVLCKIDLSA